MIFYDTSGFLGLASNDQTFGFIDYLYAEGIIKEKVVQVTISKTPGIKDFIKIGSIDFEITKNPHKEDKYFQMMTAKATNDFLVEGKLFHVNY